MDPTAPVPGQHVPNTYRRITILVLCVITAGMATSNWPVAEVVAISDFVRVFLVHPWDEFR